MPVEKCFPFPDTFVPESIVEVDLWISLVNLIDDSIHIYMRRCI